MASTKLPARLLDTSAVPALTVAGDLTVDTNTLYVDSGNNNVGIGTNSPGEKLEVKGDASYIEITHPTASSYTGMKFSEGGTPQGSIQNIGSTFSTVARRGNLEIFHNTGGNVTLQHPGGNVGIGTSSPERALHIQGGAADTALKISNTPAGSGSSDGFEIIVENPTPDVVLRQRENNKMRFLTNNTQAMSIDASGHIGMGNADAANATGITSAGYSGACLHLKQSNSSTAGAQIRLTNGTSGHTTGDGFFISKWSDLNTYYYEFEGNHLFYTGGTIRFTIGASGGVNGSDEKWKENIVDIPYGLDTVKALKPRKFKWKDSGEDSVGFIAQEVKPIIGEVITDPQEDGPPEADSGYMLNYSAMTAVLTKAIQEQQTIIEDLKSRIETLEG